MSQADYSRNLRSLVRSFWGGVMSIDDFFALYQNAIRRELTVAWREGAATCGIAPDEFTNEENIALDSLIVGEGTYIFPFALDIEAGSKAEGGLLTPLLKRVDMWANRWTEARTRGLTMACGNKKLRWDLGEAEHCSSCLKLAGKVKRASWWHENGIIPRKAGATYLECKGFKCQCELNETTEPLSRGRMPSLP